MKYEIVPFKKEHLENLTIREIEENALKAFTESVQEKICEPAFTGLCDGKVIAIGGVIILWDGVGEGWIYGTTKIEKHKLFFMRGVLKKLKEIEKKYNLHRVQATVVFGVKGLIKFVEFLGFEFEGRLRGYGVSKEDYLIFGRNP